MVELFLSAFLLGLMVCGLRRPFLWVLAYLYVDILAPQYMSKALLASLPISLITFLAAVGGWLLIDDKRDSRFTFRQGLLLVLMLYCGLTTMSADVPAHAADKWGWVWKALLFAVFLPLTLRTRLRIEAVTLVMTLTAGAIIIGGGIKTIVSGGGYGELQLFVTNNTGLYEGSIISCVAITLIPVILWLMKYGTIFPPDWRVRLFGIALIFACLLIPIGTQARTGLICIGVLGLLSLRTVKRRFLYIAMVAAAVMVAIPFLPQSYVERMNTIENHDEDVSASGRVAVWKWTWEYVQEHPLGGGFDSYRGNAFRYVVRKKPGEDDGTDSSTKIIEDKARAFHSSYFELLGEQGFPGFLIWIWLQLLGIWQMERLRARWRKRTGPDEQWQAPLANALQQAHIVFLTGSLFVGIAYQPFIFMLIGVQCGLWSYLKRIDAGHVPSFAERQKLRAMKRNVVAAPGAAQ